MDMLKIPDPDEMLLKDLTDDIIKSFYLVYNKLGYGFLEQVYQNALFLELKKKHDCKPQYDIDVYYDGYVVGKYRADFVVDDLVILELKAASELNEAHATQLQNYLKATKYEVGLLLNFGKQAQIKRKVFENKYK